MASEIVLGLDLGIASVGWALVRREDGESKELIGLGVRVFEEGVSNKGQGDKEESHASARRQKRLARRNLERRARRLNRVYNLVAKVGLLPVLPEHLSHPRTPSGEGSAANRQRLVDETKRARHEALQTLELGAKDPDTGRRPAAADPNCLVGKYRRDDLPVERFLPYFLRDRAIHCALEPHELGRALYSLAQRRGVWWNRADDSPKAEENKPEEKKSKRASKKDDDSKSESGKVNAAVAEQQVKLNKFGEARKLERPATLGEFYSALLTNDSTALDIDKAGCKPEEYQLRVRNRAKVYNRCTTREMVKAEFNLIWDSQLKHHAGNAAMLAILNSTVDVPPRSEKVIERNGRPVVKYPGRPGKTVPLREAVFKAIFHQRKLKNASHLIGACELENHTKHRRECDGGKNEISRSRPLQYDRKRAPAGHPFATRFKMLKMVNETRVFRRRSADENYTPFPLDGASEPGALPPALRGKLVEILSSQQSPEWAQARKELGLSADIRFNFELQTRAKAGKGGNQKKEKGSFTPSHKHFIGDVTAAKFSEIFGAERWQRMCQTKAPSGMTEAEEVFWDWYACQDPEALAFIGAVRWKLDGMTVANPGGLLPSQIVEECAKLRADAARRRRENPSNPGKSAMQIAQERFGKVRFEGPAKAFGDLKLPQGYARYSTAALKHLLNHPTWGMERGHTEGTARDMLYVARKVAMGPGTTPQLKPLVEVFPTLNNPVVKRTLSQLRLVVNELIKVKLGGTPPHLIRVEMTREMQTNREGREAIQLRQDMNRKANENAAKLLGLDPETTSSELKRKVQLAQEAGWHCPYCGLGYEAQDIHSLEIEHIIPTSILSDNSFANLTLAHKACNILKGGRTPFQARHDFKRNWHDILNHVAVFRSTEKYFDSTKEERWTPSQRPPEPKPENSATGKRRKTVPKAAQAKEGERHERGHPKLRLFMMDDAALEEHKKRFTNADLTQTGYITKVALGYLATLYGLSPDTTERGRHLQVSNGSITALLRDELGEPCSQCQIKHAEPDKGKVIDGWISVNHVLRDGGSREPGDGRNPLSGERRKKERKDHRHHAVDAAIVAVTDPHRLLARLQTAFRNSRQQEQQRGRYSWGRVQAEVLPQWPTFYRDLYEFIHVKDQFGHGFKGVVVSHATNRRVEGALHRETLYGQPIDDDGERASWSAEHNHWVRVKDGAPAKGEVRSTIRVALHELSTKEILSPLTIVSADVRQRCQDQLRKVMQQAGTREISEPAADADKKSTDAAKHLKDKPPLSAFGHPIRMVVVRDSKIAAHRIGRGESARFVNFGSNHHLEVLKSYDSEDWLGELVSTFEANRRRNTGTAVVRTDAYWKAHGKQFVFALHLKDSIVLEERQGSPEVFVVRTFDDSNVEFVRANDAREKKDIKASNKDELKANRLRTAELKDLKADAAKLKKRQKQGEAIDEAERQEVLTALESAKKLQEQAEADVEAAKSYFKRSLSELKKRCGGATIPLVRVSPLGHVSRIKE